MKEGCLLRKAAGVEPQFLPSGEVEVLLISGDKLLLASGDLEFDSTELLPKLFL